MYKPVLVLYGIVDALQDVLKVQKHCMHTKLTTYVPNYRHTHTHYGSCGVMEWCVCVAPHKYQITHTHTPW